MTHLATPRHAAWPAAPWWQRSFCAQVARVAVRCLYTELTLYPKPGLVSLVDNGSHTDMNAATFMRSMFALRRYFGAICQAGIDGAPFGRLKQLGIEAEKRMLKATGDINTHRGAIFSVGLLCAAIGRARAQSMRLTPSTLRAVLLLSWGEELAGHTADCGAASNGLRAAALHGASGAREEAALGFPSVFEVALPALAATLAAGRGHYLARIDTLFTLMAHMSDTNVFHRAGSEGAALVRERARTFLDLGGTAHPAWKETALQCHREFVASRISPGGAADLLAATCLVHSVTTQPIP
ncbi:triphosphoribosyl-dephospho-CoA synthase MdcB [Massilia agilis]|uniref:Probable 2-(5''-triphosphoribosyl)-3'-dephosphocoenzyme-A synthase n=1 Tax=Massilia agilis TaxID=1811226 RepID=A0ABT2D8W4_9BURK|nr:triphosphoribosyl-dephospho-CoA synthase MdcB [Massilia agilis]MCS0807731.1 triphosphoribosyl-dephospho-CoA synthase MdcB [Massilia agilis]